MAFDKTPTAWIPGYTSNGTTLSIPLASLPGLSSGDANASSGDIRKIILALVDQLAAAYNAKPAADRPSSLGIAKADYPNSAPQKQYTFIFTGAVSAFQLASE